MNNLIFLSMILIFVSCETAITKTEKKSREETALAHLKEMGFNTSDAIFTDNAVIVEGDIRFDLNKLLTSRSERNKGRVYKNGGFGKIASNRVDKIYVIIYPEVPSNWVSAVHSAVAKWNDISLRRNGRSKIHLKIGEFGKSYENAIRIYLGNGPLAEFPFNGSPGCAITVPKDWLNADEKEHTIMLHELGHALGFAHSNTGFNTSEKIPGTNDDPKNGTYFSIMQTGGRRGYLTYDDKLSAIKLYPKTNPR